MLKSYHCNNNTNKSAENCFGNLADLYGKGYYGDFLFNLSIKKYSFIQYFKAVFFQLRAKLWRAVIQVHTGNVVSDTELFSNKSRGTNTTPNSFKICVICIISNVSVFWSPQ